MNKRIIKVLLIIGIILWIFAHILPSGELIIGNVLKIEFFHWGLWRFTDILTNSQQFQFMPTNFSGVPGSPELIGFAFANLLLYIIFLLSISSLVAGIIAIKHQNPLRSSFYAGILCVGTALLFFIFIEFLKPGFAGLMKFYKWSYGFYSMLGSAVAFFIAHVLLRSAKR